MPASRDILKVLKAHFGYDSFRPMQEEVISSVLARHDTLVLMPTGGGKSLCYQLPALCLDGLALVVSPLIALMKDQVDALRANGIPAAYLNSTLTASESAGVRSLARSGQLKVLYVAPERLALPGFRDFLRTVDLSLIAVDEAHCISEWGHDFRPDYRNLKVLRQEFPQVPIIALTASATERVRQDIIVQLDLRGPRTFVSSFNRTNLTYLVRPKRNAFEALLALLKKHSGEAAIIYCLSRKDTEDLAADLVEHGFKALPYHAGLENSARKEAQERFIRDEVPIIVATIAFGMGIDKPDVRLVVHYTLPRSLEWYYQETGRAGRDGLPSECVLFYSYGDKFKQEFFIGQMEDRAQQEQARQKLAQMVEFCELSSCRRRYLLAYFGEQLDGEGCAGCDVCLAPRQEEVDATEIVQKVLSAVIRTGERFGASHVIEVLRGSRSRGLADLGHDRLSVYGIARDCSSEELRRVVGLLLERGLLARRGTDYPTLAVTQEGRAFLGQRQRISLPAPSPPEEPAAAPASQGLPYDQGLFEKLRELRRSIAAQRNVPPYVVFSDQTLQQMACYVPQTREALSRITGVGAVKLEQSGDAFLSVIRHYARLNGLQSKEVPTRQPQRVSGTRREGSTYDETRKLVKRRLPLEEIARRRGLTVSTILSHLERLAEVGEKLDIAYLLPPAERLEAIRAAFQRAGTFTLTPVREALGEDYSYEELRLVRLWLRQNP